MAHRAASHTIEFDDIFRDAIYHPGVVTVPAALALAQSRGVSGAALLRAVIAGYEVGTRIGTAVVPAHYEFWHTTGTVGCFGAAAAASTVLRLDATGTAHALANAGTLAAGAPYSKMNVSVAIPGNLSGTYYLFVLTDRFNQVFENLNENNNSRAAQPIHITLAPPPDLVVRNVSVPATAPAM